MRVLLNGLEQYVLCHGVGNSADKSQAYAWVVTISNTEDGGMHNGPIYTWDRGSVKTHHPSDRSSVSSINLV